ESGKEQARKAPPEPRESDPLIKRLLDLQSESATVVRSALESQTLDPLLVSPTVRLLARDDLSEDAIRALRRIGTSSVGQLTDALLNPDEDFAVRRRVPRVLAYCPVERAVEGLMRGLADSRFEVRFSCGRALSRIHGTNYELQPLPQQVYA